MVAGQINQNTLDHFTLMSEAVITTYTGQNSQDTKAIAHQDDAILLPLPNGEVLILCIQVFFNTDNITWWSEGQQKQALI